jgi:hypothetical protein
MNLVAEGCTKAHGCHASPASHPGYAWATAILFVLGIVVYGLYVIRRARLTKAQANAAGSVTDNNGQGNQKRTVAERPSIYDLLQPHAKNVKAALQMAIGIITVIAIGWRYIDSLGNVDATKVFLDGIGIGLAATAALELAYTLFTDGPDEALDPLMLGLASTLLLKLAGLSDTASFSQVGVLALLALLLIGLFAARLMLAESTEQPPKIWWIRLLRAPGTDRGQPLPSEDVVAAEPNADSRESERVRA